MAEPQPNIQSILAALAAQRPASTPTQTPPGAPTQAFPPPPGASQPGHYQPGPPGAPGYHAPPPGLPAPASSGNVDLSAIRPVNSGTVNFDDIVSKARALAGQKGATSYDRPLVYNSEARGQDRGFQSRSRSPRGDYHDSYRDDRRGGYGRDYGRDRSHSPQRGGRQSSPRGGNRDRSPIRGGDDSSEIIEIESSLVGLIIGRQGENLRRIEAESKCRVQFLASTDGGPFRQCKITGPRARRVEVKDAINQIIEDSGMGALNRGGDKSRAPHDKGNGAGALREGEDHVQIMVPDRTVGLIIGRGGETIRDLQERSGCHINIVGESKSVNGLRPVNLIGTREAATRAKDAIMEIVDSDSRGEATGSRAGGGRPPMGGRDDGQSRPGAGGQYGGGGGDKITDTVYVPSDAVGMIIGKGGETIREMQNGTGCKINVQQGQPGETEREITLIGSRDSIAQAKQAIEEKVDAVRQKSGGGGGGGRGGRGGYQDHDRGSYSNQGPSSGTNSQPPAASGDDADPYAQYGGYQNYVALWYQSLMLQQQAGGQGAPPGAPAPGAK
ncbi:hypothetical protein NLU13_5166 [Sarocladium strictum]|uniref:K Homology domain-containing protein n=1 Tax=Sarocladium strictum TaxID=5046 RepID=A0AA39L7D0_SARSR|nr:hypothetical protein NLU13_5166 [Sarocladium strictum]